MEKAKVFRAIRRKLKVQRGSRAEITNLPFAPGSKVEVIVVGPQPKETSGSRNSIYNYTAALTRRRRLPRYSMKQIERIIHESRESRG